MRWLVVLCLLVGVAHAEGHDDVHVTVGYRAGRPIRLALVPVDWTWLDLQAAHDYREMQAAARAAGVELLIRSGFRSHQRQTMLYAAWRAGYGNRAARPGYSLHQSGRALDLYVSDMSTRSWLGKHARAFGFQRTVGDEPWHFEYIGRPRRTRKR